MPKHRKKESSGQYSRFPDGFGPGVGPWPYGGMFSPGPGQGMGPGMGTGPYGGMFGPGPGQGMGPGMGTGPYGGTLGPGPGQGMGPGMQPVSPELIRNIERAINGEYQAIQYYRRLAELAPNQEARQTILSIRQDEIRHYNSFTRIYTQLTGSRPRVQQGSLPRTYREGLRQGIQDELEASRFYREISAMSNVPRITNRFFRASHDEFRHSVWLRNLLQQTR